MRNNISFEAQLTRFSLLSSVPLLILLLWAMTKADISTWLVTLTALCGTLLIFYSGYQVHQRLIYRFRNLNNLLDAMAKGDYCVRVRSDQSCGALMEVTSSINNLALRLSQQSRESKESQLLLQTVIEHIDVAIIAINQKNDVRFANPAAKKLLRLNDPDSRQSLLDQLAFVQSFPSGSHRIAELCLGHQRGRFYIHIEEFRESGTQHRLLFITDVQTLLRGEEKKAWQSLIRVISHEINNSLSPIVSISQTLRHLMQSENDLKENEIDIKEGLAVISERAESLRQFLANYKQVTALPKPCKQWVSVLELLEKTRALFVNEIILESRQDVKIFVDPVQFEQVLINLLKNACEALAQSSSNDGIRISWQVVDSYFRLDILDRGYGISNLKNLFIPFYTTKKNGSGIGLTLCRQIIEAHGGNLMITNQDDSSGCCATVEIPLLDAFL